MGSESYGGSGGTIGGGQTTAVSYCGEEASTGPAMSEREIAIATFTAVSEIYTHLFGRRLTVKVETEGGTLIIDGPADRVE